MKTTRNVLLLGIVMLAAALIAATSTSAQKEGKSRPLTTSQMMAGLVKPKHVTLKAGLEKGPETDEDWQALATDAALLNESGYLMMADDRCPDQIWEDAAELLRTSTARLLAQIEKRDAEAALKSIESVSMSCKACHTEHKYKKKP